MSILTTVIASLGYVSFYATIATAFVTAGFAILLVVYKAFVFISIPPVIINTISYVYNIIFNSLDLLSFFVRPSTVKLVCVIFSMYWVMKLVLKTFLVTFRIGRHITSFISALIGKALGGILSFLGLAV